MFRFIPLILLLFSSKSYCLPNSQIALENFLSEDQSISQKDMLKSINKKFEALEAFSFALNLLNDTYIIEKNVEAKKLIIKAIKGIASKLDPHTMYLSNEQLKELMMTSHSNKTGLILEPRNDNLKVIAVIDSSLAFNGGLNPGDTILKVNNILVTKKNRTSLLKTLKHSTSLKIHYARFQKGKLIKKSVSIGRHKQEHNVTHTRLNDNYEYLKINLFESNTENEIRKILKKRKNLKGIILDLRDNPGGLFEQAVRISNLFIPSGIIVSTEGRDPLKDREFEYAKKRLFMTDIPLVVLINENSASASEILAGSLKDHGRAFLIGQKSFGKGTVQTVVPLPHDFGGLKITISQYKTPKGHTIQANGIMPDIIIAKETKTTIPKAHESQLESHIGQNQSDLNPKLSSKSIKKWPKHLHDDEQVKAAFAYLKGLYRMQDTKYVLENEN